MNRTLLVALAISIASCAMTPEESRALADAINGTAEGFAAGRQAQDSGNYTVIQGAQPAGCAASYDCPSGTQCIKGAGMSRGMCGRLVNPSGLPSTALPPAGRMCLADLDCGMGFKCSKQVGYTYGLCSR